MADDDSIDDDVFETKESTISTSTLNTNEKPTTTPSPTGYRDYKPPAEVLRLCETDNIEELEQTIHKVKCFSYIVLICMIVFISLEIWQHC